MKLFTVGPVEMYPETRAVAGQQVPYFRNDFFSDVMTHCDSLLRQQLGHLDTSYRSIVLTASGTGAMEATVINCLTPNDRVIVIDGGSFGHRFVQLCERHNIPCDALTLSSGQALTAEMLAPFAAQSHTALLVNLDETSTGQLYDIDMLSTFCHENDLLFIVDAISAFLADPIDMKTAGVDALIISSQKALSLEPGLSIVMLAPRMISERVENITSSSMYFDFKDCLKNGERGQTPFTPAVGIVLQLENMLQRIDTIGVEVWIEHTRELALDFRTKLAQLPLEIPHYPLSNALTPIIFPKNNASVCNERLINEYGLVLNPCGGADASRMSRVAHIGNHTISDNDELIAALAEILS
jgi:aspartate aminotransferase-like enzyme